MEIAGFIVEVLILAAVVWEGWISHQHYESFKTKKERAAQKQKATKLIRKVLK